MSMLNLTSIPKSVSGQAQLLEIASTMADLERPFDAADTESVDKFVQCANAASEFFSVIENRVCHILVDLCVFCWINQACKFSSTDTEQEYAIC